jgi:hypothetical protein
LRLIGVPWLPVQKECVSLLFAVEGQHARAGYNSPRLNPRCRGSALLKDYLNTGRGTIKKFFGGSKASACVRLYDSKSTALKLSHERRFTLR